MIEEKIYIFLKCKVRSSILSLYHNELNIFNDTGAHMLNSINHMPLFKIIEIVVLYKQIRAQT